MKKKSILDMICLAGCVVKDEAGIVMAVLQEDTGRIVVKKTAACSLGTYLSIVTYLRDLGFDAV